MSALDFEEAGHKLMKIQLQPGQESEICTMIIECCSQEKTYSKCACVLRILFSKCAVYRVFLPGVHPGAPCRLMVTFASCKKRRASSALCTERQASFL